jgi:hypothetical protein
MKNQEEYFFKCDQHISPIILKNNNKVLFEIKPDGSVFFTKNGELVKVSNEKDLAMLFAMTIAEMNETKFTNKAELFARIASNYRNGKIDTIFSDI